ncbi:Phosphate-selective porin O and P [compost metagenome]
MKNALALILVNILIFSFPVLAQQTANADLDQDTIDNYSAFKRSISFSGLLQMRFLGSLTKNVNTGGKNFNESSENKTLNTFLLRRARLHVKGNVNDRFSTSLTINFAEFNNNPTNKVLENAFVKYTLSKRFNIQAGQFRPFFGAEDFITSDNIRTLDYSNQYYAFGASGWQSFQIGVSVFGNLSKTDKLPLNYYFGIYNGNNKNQLSDHDNSKNVYGRLTTSPTKNLTIGVNAASGSFGSGSGNAWGADISGKVELNKKWKFSLSGEYKQGNNFALYNAYTIKPDLKEVKMRGLYIFPILRYEYKHPRLRAIEFSTRYERFDADYKLNSNLRQTIIPNMTLIFADDFYAALQGGVSIDLYKTDIPLTTTYSRNLAYLQLQIRF